MFDIWTMLFRTMERMGAGNPGDNVKDENLQKYLKT
jgi:hypothetical protein